MQLSRRSLFIIIVVLVSLAFSAILAQAREPAQASAPMVKATSSQFMVTAKGMTLYVFALDKPNVSACYGTCAKFWPPMLVSAGMQPATTMSGFPGKFGTIVRKDGSHQLTYDEAPLYTFVKDKKPNDMYGQGLYASNGFWWAIVVPGASMAKSPGSGGY